MIRFRTATIVAALLGVTGCETPPVAPASTGDIRIDLPARVFTVRQVQERVIEATVSNVGTAVWYTNAGDGFGGGLITALGSDAVVERFDGAVRWAPITASTAIEGVREVLMAPGATIGLWADLSRTGAGTYRLRVGVRDRPSAGSGGPAAIAYSATFEVR
jgi:hypothetical protein